MNQAKAGSAIPVKFSLTGNVGMDIIAEGYPWTGFRQLVFKLSDGTIPVANEKGIQILFVIPVAGGEARELM